MGGLRIVLTVVILGMAAVLLGMGMAPAQPPLPLVYSGAVTVAGRPAPDGLRLVAALDGYETAPATVKGGRYAGLVVGPRGPGYVGKQVQFYLVSDEGRAQARERDVFTSGATPENRALDLTFGGLPGLEASTRGAGSPLALLVLGAVAALAVGAASLGVLRRSGRRSPGGRG